MKQALTGGAYMAHSVIASAQRCLNLFSEPLPEGQHEPAPVAAYPTPGTRLLSTIGTGPIRGIRQCTTGGVYVVSGSEVYSINVADWTGTLLGSITPGLRTPVSMADNGLDLVIVDGTASGWKVTLASNAFAQIVDPEGMFLGATRVDYLDTFLIFNKPATPQFYWTGSLALTFDTLDFANKQSYSDLLVTLIVAKREIWLLGERTSEVWYDAGPTDIGAGSSQFAQVQSVFIDHGIAAKYSVANYDNGIFWLTRDRQGQGFVIHGAGYQTKRISTYAIEAEIGGYARIDDAIGFCYQTGGHTFYVLTFPHADKTWVFDITTGLWHEWLWIDSNGNEHRHRANCFWPVNSTLVIGDWQSGNLYELRRDVFTDNNQPIKRLRSYPHTLNEGKRVFYRQFLADIETGTSSAVERAEVTRLNASFTAADGTNLDAYTSEVGGGWVAIGGEDNAEIHDNLLVGTGGEALYASAATLLTADYSVRFDVVPPRYDSVVADTSLWAIGRATALGTGYRAKVAADGVQYTLSLATAGAPGPSASVAMGTLASGFYTVWLVLRGTTITAQVQRSQDSLWLRGDGAWQSGSGTAAAQFTDGTFTAPGVVAIGGQWPVPTPAVPPTLTFTPQVSYPSDANFPSGFSYYTTIYGHGFQTFDFTRNRYYALISGTVSGVSTIGILIIDLSTMTALGTVTLAQMYAGTAYGSPPGSWPTGSSVWNITTGDGTDIYLLVSPNKASQYFVRVDAVTLKVTGELFGFGGHDILNGAASRTASRDIVCLETHPAFGLGQLLMDGTGMATIGYAATPVHSAYNAEAIPGARHPDGSCDLVMIDSDLGGSGNINLWRINVSDSLIITSTMTGTFDANTVYDPNAGSTAWVGQLNYDAANDAIILWLQQDINGPETWFTSVNWDGSVNWSTHIADAPTTWANRGQGQLTGNTLMVGPMDHPVILDTETGAIIYDTPPTAPGLSTGYYFHVWDASRSSYWSYQLATYGFSRLDFIEAVLPPILALDNVVCTTEAPLPENLISLSASDDRGHSYGNPVSQSMGAVGEYRKSLIWRRLGMARDRVFKLEWSVPASTALQGAWVEVDSAES